MLPLVIRRSAGICALPLLLAAGCTSGSADADSDRLRVVTTVAPLTSIVANVAGDRVELAGLVPEGTNSHTFEPPPSAAKVLSEADVVFVNGLQLEDPTLELAADNLRDGAEVVELGTRVLPKSDYLYDFSFPRSGGKPNPHLWTHPGYAVEYAEVVRDVLSARSPADAAYFSANTAAFTTKANALSDAVRRASATVPAPRRQLLTYHDGYAYFAKDYGWTVLGAIQPANFEDPTAKEVAAIIRQIKAQRVPAIFGSEVFPSEVLEQIGKDTGARYVDVLRDDDLPGKPGDPEHSWLALMRFDYVTMVEALGGDASALKVVDLADVTPDRARYPQ